PGAGAGGLAGASRAVGASPSPSSRAMISLTLTPWAPSGTTIRPTVPSSAASTSMVALSVSISAMTSPERTVSPSLTSQRARLPSVMVGDSAGMRMLIGMRRPRSVPVEDGLGCGHDIGWLRQRQLLEIGGVGHRHVHAGHPQDGRVEMIERPLHHLGG